MNKANEHVKAQCITLAGCCYRQGSFGKVMFSVMSVCHSVHRGVSMWPPLGPVHLGTLQLQPWSQPQPPSPCRHSCHCPSPSPALPLGPHRTWTFPYGLKPVRLNLTVQAPPKDWLDSGRLTFDWNAFLLVFYFPSCLNILKSDKSTFSLALLWF